MGTNPSYYKGDIRMPVEQIGIDDIQLFLSRLDSEEAVSGKYRLPTEAEWEYAARAGNTAVRYGAPGDVAWYAGNSSNTTHAVGGKAANAWGLFDMLGNVLERTSDWYGAYGSNAERDPAGPLSGSLRVIRGGAWDHGSASIRAASRSYFGDGGTGSLGFRPVRTLP
ncbi:MAG: hypothetical protein RL199_693 [Pseudomonadota bacterium]|jgi:formylglycine-generating enzyme required for sulfatase activity